MRVALIPPASLLYRIAEDELHMVIPEGLRNPVYNGFYKVLGLREGTTVMMDNGAFEAEGGRGIADERLIEMIYTYNVDTLVLPDVMGNHIETIQVARQFIHMYEMHLGFTEPALGRIQFLGAVQGSDEATLRRCVEMYSDLEEEFEISIMLGLPRWTADEINAQIRYRLAKWITENDPHAIHLLGMTRLWPEEIMRIAQDIPTVQSIDTSAPFIWAYNGDTLGVPGTGAERPPNYFGLDPRQLDSDIVERNIDIIRGWANGQA